MAFRRANTRAAGPEQAAKRSWGLDADIDGPTLETEHDSVPDTTLDV